MDFGIGEDAVALSAALGEFFDRRGDGRAIVDSSAADGGPTRERWESLCGIGIPALRVPEPLGIGASLLDTTAVAERFGVVLLPEPAVTAIVLARALVGRDAWSDVVDALLDGSRVPCLATHHDSRVRVADDDITDLIAVPASGGLAMLDRAGLREAVQRHDVDTSRPTALHQVDASASQTVSMTQDEIDALLREWAVLTTSELVGGMQAILTGTVEYAQQRQQFGRSIGSFQSVKHQLADMFVAVQQARAAVQFAAISCDDAAATVATDVGAATRWVPSAAIGLFESAIHLHGAMGYSWEGAVHLQLRRAVATRSLLRESNVAQPRTLDAGMAS